MKLGLENLIRRKYSAFSCGCLAINASDFDKVKLQLVALGIIDSFVREEAFGDAILLWQITKKELSELGTIAGVKRFALA